MIDVAGVKAVHLFVLCILGHFVGDYLLQSRPVATTKSQKGLKGVAVCSLHVFLYTLAIYACSGLDNIWFLLSIFIPHWVIDRHSLVKYWMNFINGYDLKDTWTRAPLCAAPAPDQLEQNVWKVSFAALVYAVTDNTVHWLCIYFSLRYFYA